MTQDDRHAMAAGRLRATVQAHGAELCSLQDTEAGELLWQAEPPWLRHAPVLFPIVGLLRGGTLHVDGQPYHLPQHGFARDRVFTWEQREPTQCRLVLQDDPMTRASFPFAFRLELTYRLTDSRLSVTLRITNTGETVLPASCGAHPGFRWPLRPDLPREAHWLEFSAEEPEPIRRLRDGLLRPDPEPSPIRGRILPLHRSLFANDAVILDHPASSSVRYLALGAVGLEIGWEGFTQLGLWSREGGDFLCIEPWHGTADPVDFIGEFTSKPGLMLLPPGSARDLRWWVRTLPG